MAKITLEVRKYRFRCSPECDLSAPEVALWTAGLTTKTCKQNKETNMQTQYQARGVDWIGWGGDDPRGGSNPIDK